MEKVSCPLFLLLLFATAPLSAAPPLLAANGIRHGATQIPTALPAARLAPNSRLTLTGIRLAAPGVQPRVTLRSGTRDFSLPLVSPATAEKLEAVIPAGVPPGPATLTIQLGAESSPPYAVTLAPAAPGLYTRTGLGWGPAAITNPAPIRPGTAIVVPATGIGRNAPRAFIGNTAVATTIVRRPAPGLADLQIPIPAGAPTGCHVPLQLDTGALPTNTVIVAIAPCDPRSSTTPSAEVGPTYGVAIRTDVVATGATDIWAGFFQLNDARQAGPLLHLPPPGTCLAATFAADTDTPLGPSLPALLLRGNPRILPAGPHLNLFAGKQTLRIPVGEGSVYQRKLAPPLPPGPLMLSAQGSSRIGSFSLPATDPVRLASVSLPEAGTRLNRTQSLLLQWQPAPGAVPHSVLAALTVRDPQQQLYGFLICHADSAATRFTVPPRVLAALPNAPTGSPASSLWLATLPTRATPIQAAHLDIGYYVPAALYSTTVFLP